MQLFSIAAAAAAENVPPAVMLIELRRLDDEDERHLVMNLMRCFTGESRPRSRNFPPESAWDLSRALQW